MYGVVRGLDARASLSSAREVSRAAVGHQRVRRLARVAHLCVYVYHRQQSGNKFPPRSGRMTTGQYDNDKALLDEPSTSDIDSAAFANQHNSLSRPRIRVLICTVLKDSYHASFNAKIVP